MPGKKKQPVKSRERSRAPAAGRRAPAGARGATILARELEAVGRKHREKLAACKGRLLVCGGTGCTSAGGLKVREALAAALKARKLAKDWRIVQTGCHGFCAQGPLLVVQPEGIFYQKLNEKGVAKIVEDHVVGGKPVESLMHKDLKTGQPIPKLNDIPFFARQQSIALRNRGMVDPEDIESAIAAGGYEALRKALTTMTPAGVVAEVKRSGLRGRGGAGFPTGLKWESCLEEVARTGRKPVLICNASAMETDPHAVLEGMCLGAYALGASEGLIHVRREYPLLFRRLELAIEQARKCGLLGKKILGTDFGFEVRARRGAGAFVGGESSALLAALEGQAAEPRAKYVHAAESGYLGRPTVVNNVETWINVPAIVERGGAWFGAIGSGDVSQSAWGGSSGTKVFALGGAVHNTGLVEVPLGTRLREIVFDIGGGIPGGRELKAVQIGGPSGGCLPADRLDMPVDFDALAEAGSMVGSGAMIVMDDRTCMVDVARYCIDFLKEESCGKCTPCREGLIAVSEILGAITRGQATEAQLAELQELGELLAGSSFCRLGGTAANPVLSTLKYFREEYVEHIRHKKCPARVCKTLIRYAITEQCNGCGVCLRNCPTKCITGAKKQRHVIDENACIRCGICLDVCKFDSVRVE